MVDFKTNRILVKIYTADFVIQGNVHLKLGGYQERISDLLNLGKMKYLPVTEVKYNFRSKKNGEQVESTCVIINVDSIEVIDVLE